MCKSADSKSIAKISTNTNRTTHAYKFEIDFIISNRLRVTSSESIEFFISLQLCCFPVLQQFGLLFADRLKSIGLTTSQITTIINLNSCLTSCVGKSVRANERRFQSIFFLFAHWHSICTSIHLRNQCIRNWMAVTVTQTANDIHVRVTCNSIRVFTALKSISKWVYNYCTVPLPNFRRRPSQWTDVPEILLSPSSAVWCSSGCIVDSTDVNIGLVHHICADVFTALR